VTARPDLRAVFANVPLVIGALALAGLVVVALFGDRLAPYDPQAWRIVEFYDNRIVVPPSAPDSHHLLGTDPLGRDQLSRLLWGARLSLQITLMAVVLRLGLGLSLGAAANATRGLTQTAVITLTNVWSSYPQLLLALLLGVALRDLHLLGFVIALGAVGWPGLARFFRAELGRIGRAPHVEAARSTGATETRILFVHIVRVALPQIIAVTALETAAVLLLLAELGFIGLFLAGSVGFVDDAGQPVLPVRDLTPEWGQMLAGAYGYITTREWVAYVPALAVVSAVFAFNLFGEGVRVALNPHDQRALSPRALSWGGRGLAAVVTLSLAAFTVSVLAGARGLTYEAGLQLATAAAARERPGSHLVASVVRFGSQAHGLDRPEKLNYYFVDPEGLTLRVGYGDAEANAAQVVRFEDDDGLGAVATFAPLADPVIGWQEALARAEREGGEIYRSVRRGWTVQVILYGSPIGPIYRVRYAVNAASPGFEVPIDARTGSTNLPMAIRLGPTFDDLRQRLGGDPILARINLTWRRSGLNGGFGAKAASAWRYDFISASGGTGYWSVTFGVGRPAEVLMRSGPLPAALADPIEVQPLFDKIEASVGQSLRSNWAAQNVTDWVADGSLERVSGELRFTVLYVGGTERIAYQMDVATARIQRVDLP
jgi:peptide/nickel transport system permease protein